MDIAIRPYAGTAFLSDDEKQMEYFKGFHNALEKMRKHVEEKRLRLPVEEAKLEEKTFSAHVKEQLETLKDYDHELFEEVIQGLVRFGWKEEGGSGVFRLLHRGGASIKIFRNEDAPEVIKMCWSAPPEVEDEDS